MGETYRVAIHHDSDCGYIEYHPATKEVKVVLGDAAKRREIESFLHNKQALREAQCGLRDFRDLSAVPTESLAALKLALTMLWQHTGVLVDWSRPVTV